MHNQALPVLYWIARRIAMVKYEAMEPEIVTVLDNAPPFDFGNDYFFDAIHAQ